MPKYARWSSKAVATQREKEELHANPQPTFGYIHSCGINLTQVNVRSAARKHGSRKGKVESPSLVPGSQLVYGQGVFVAHAAGAVEWAMLNGGGQRKCPNGTYTESEAKQTDWRSTAQPGCEKHKKQRSKGAKAEEMFSDSTAVSLQEGCIPIDVLGLITT